MPMPKAEKNTQSDKFKDAAIRAECDTDEASFEDKLKKLAKTKPDMKPSKK